MTADSRWLAGDYRVIRLFSGVLCLLILLASWGTAFAQTNTTYTATFTDTEGLRTDVTNLSFYWEEQLSDTQLALHELMHVPAKRGSVPIQIKFEKIKRIDFKPATGSGGPVLSITLKNGKTGEFTLEIPGSFKGHTDFGEMIAKPSHLKRIVFK